MKHPLIESYKEMFSDKYHFDGEEFFAIYQEWIIKFGETEKSKADFVWSMFNRIANSYAGKFKNELEMYTFMRGIYADMWQFLLKEGRDSSHVKRLMHYCDLKTAGDENYKVNAQIIGTKCCPECDEIDGLVIPLDEAINKQILPFKGCTRKNGCICCYGFPYERDLENNLVRK